MLRSEDCFKGNKVICIHKNNKLISGKSVYNPLVIGNIYVIDDYVPPNAWPGYGSDTECVAVKGENHYYFGLTHFRPIPNGLEVFYDILSKPIDENAKDESKTVKTKEKV